MILDSARTFLLNNARLLENRWFDVLFLDGSWEAAFAALKAYQNLDGGFGYGLEPDKRTPSSQPIDQEVALVVMDDIGFDPVTAGRICAFLQTITLPDGGVPYVLPTVADAPRTPWWNTDANPPASINPTGSIAGLLHKHGFQHPWLERATQYCWNIIEGDKTFEVHDALRARIFLEHVPDRERALKAFKPFKEQVFANGLITLDPHASGYVKTVLDWAPTPGSLFRPLFDDQTIQAHLAALAEQQQSDGGWPITWTTVSPGAELECRGVLTLRALKILKAYEVIS